MKSYDENPALLKELTKLKQKLLDKQNQIETINTELNRIIDLKVKELDREKKENLSVYKTINELNTKIKVIKETNKSLTETKTYLQKVSLNKDQTINALTTRVNDLTDALTIIRTLVSRGNYV